MSNSTSIAVESASQLSSKLLSDITVYSKYARYNPTLGRRENWGEIVSNVVNMHKQKFPHLEREIDDAFKFVLQKKVIPSMRSMQFSGRSIDLCESRVFNCAYLPVDDRVAFREIMFLLLCGTGVGYSVQRHHIDKLPAIKTPERSQRYVVGDSIEGWSDALNRLCKAYFEGKTRPIFEYGDIRPAGSPLRKTGGKAPGPAKLKRSLSNIEQILKSAIGRKLLPIEVHDIVCHIADCVVAGGIRDSAMISLFSPDDMYMATAKSYLYVKVHGYENGTAVISVDENLCAENGIYPSVYSPLNQFYIKMSEYEYEQLTETGKLLWWYLHPHRGKANNSAVLLRSDTTKAEFYNIWNIVRNSGSGEPGFYFTNNIDMGTNPCCEIALQPFQFCNLTSVNVSNVESQEDLEERVKAAAFIGTLQASYTNLHYLRPVWIDNTERESLLGVSMTGIAYGRLAGLDVTAAAKVAAKENVRVAELIGIKPAARVTCIKPEGSGSLALGVMGAGIHGVFDYTYIRRIRISANSALHQYLLKKIPGLVEQDRFNSDKAIVSIPIKSPENVITRHETALQFCERVKEFYTKWIVPGHNRGQNTHNISATIYIKDHEWDEIGEWMWKNRHYYNGLSILPYDGGTYIQAPYETISESQFNEMVSMLKEVNLDEVKESSDDTSLANELACAGGKCEI